MNLGETMKTYRKKAEMTQKELAEKLGLSEKTISSYEAGRNEPDLETLKAIASILKTDVVNFLGEKKHYLPEGSFIMVEYKIEIGGESEHYAVHRYENADECDWSEEETFPLHQFDEAVEYALSLEKRHQTGNILAEVSPKMVLQKKGENWTVVQA